MAKKRILIVEDEHHIAKAEELILSDDFEVHVAHDGDHGLKLAKAIRPDLMILDLMLPNRGGYDLCFHIRQDDVLKNMKILMVTAKNQDIDMDKGMLVGADDYMTKPFEADDLLNRTVSLLK